MRDRQLITGWIVLLLLVAAVAIVVHRAPTGPFDRDDAIACGTHVARELGYPVGAPRAAADDGTWRVSASGDGLRLEVVIRVADERITDVAVLRGDADVLTRDERLVVLEGGCG